MTAGRKKEGKKERRGEVEEVGEGGLEHRRGGDWLMADGRRGAVFRGRNRREDESWRGDRYETKE